MTLPDDDATTETVTTYPYEDGDTTVLGPEIFASNDGSLCWRGVRYVREPECPSGVILNRGFHFVGTSQFNGGQGTS